MSDSSGYPNSDALSHPLNFKVTHASQQLARRFRFPTPPSYWTLSGRLLSLWLSSGFTASNLTLAYVDTDGDRIVLSSDEELQAYYEELRGRGNEKQVVRMRVVLARQDDGKSPGGGEDEAAAVEAEVEAGTGIEPDADRLVEEQQLESTVQSLPEVQPSAADTQTTDLYLDQMPQTSLFNAYRGIKKQPVTSDTRAETDAVDEAKTEAEHVDYKSAEEDQVQALDKEQQQRAKEAAQAKIAERMAEVAQKQARLDRLREARRVRLDSIRGSDPRSSEPPMMPGEPSPFATGPDIVLPASPPPPLPPLGPSPSYPLGSTDTFSQYQPRPLHQHSFPVSGAFPDPTPGLSGGEGGRLGRGGFMRAAQGEGVHARYTRLSTQLAEMGFTTAQYGDLLKEELTKEMPGAAKQSDSDVLMACCNRLVAEE